MQITKANQIAGIIEKTFKKQIKKITHPQQTNVINEPVI